MVRGPHTSQISSTGNFSSILTGFDWSSRPYTDLLSFDEFFGEEKFSWLPP